MTYNKIRFKVGIFMLLFFINISGIIYYILNEKGMFDKRYTYTFKTQSADPFNIGMAIKVSGFKIGYIDNIKLKDEGSVQVSFLVDKQNRKWIRKDSVIMIRKPLLGSAQIILYPAADNPLLEDGSPITVYESDDINEVVYKLQPIVNKMENIVNSVDKITSYLARDNSELVKIVKNLESFSALLIENKSILTTVTGDQNATDSLITTINQLPVLINNINSISTNVNKDIISEVSQFTKELQDIAKDIKTKLNKLDGVVDSVGSYDSDIMGLKDEIKIGLAKSNEILEKVDSFLPKDNKSEVILP